MTTRPTRRGPQAPNPGALAPRRRDVVLGAGVLASCQPLRLRAQAAAVPRHIGFLSSFAAPAPGEVSRTVSQVLAELRALGLVEGPALRVSTRHGLAPEVLARGAEELLAEGVDLIVAVWTPAGHAARAATRRVPIVLYLAADPVATGLVPSLAAPGGNITGTSAFGPELMRKNLELLREWLPDARRVGALATAGDPFTRHYVAALEAAAAPLGLQLQVRRVGEPAAIARAIDDWRRDGVDALMVQPSLPGTGAIAVLARRHRLPSCSMSPAYVRAGGLFAYAPSVAEAALNVAVYVKRILDGELPGRLPVLRPARFDLLINAATAQAIGLALPATLRLRATEVIA